MFKAKEVARLSLLAWSRDPGKTSERLQAIIAVEARREFKRHREEVAQLLPAGCPTLSSAESMIKALLKTD